jgi:hypothetical protein
MRNIMMIILVLGAACMWACSKDLPDAGGTAAKAVANEWWVKVNDTSDVFRIYTYNTSLSPDSIWIDDLENWYGFKAKARVDVSGLTFSAQNASNEYSPATMTITNGKILRNAGISKAGNVTDSIYLEATFSDTTAKFKIAGVARTRWDNDDY